MNTTQLFPLALLGLFMNAVAYPSEASCLTGYPAANADAYRLNGDATVTDTRTGLTWKRCSEGQAWSGGRCVGSVIRRSWADSLVIAEQASFAGRSDWRVPNVKEIASLVETCRSQPAIDLVAFPDTPIVSAEQFVWSSSQRFTGMTDAWGVNFFTGTVLLSDRSALRTLRLVRGGDLALPDASGGAFACQSEPACVFSSQFERFDAGVLEATQRLNDSGIITCSQSNSANGECGTAPTGQDRFHGRDWLSLNMLLDKWGDGHAGFDFSKIANNGTRLPASATLGAAPGQWACTLDNVTGLLWEIKVNQASSARHLFHTYTWHDPDSATGRTGTLGSTTSCSNTLGGAPCNTHALIQSVNSAGLCGRNNWRLPTDKELLSIVDYSRISSPLVDPTYFPNTPTQSFSVSRPSDFWTSVPTAGVSSTSGWAWKISFDGGSSFGEVSSSADYVRLVSDRLQ